jgi:hypothetical protein
MEKFSQGWAGSGFLNSIELRNPGATMRLTPTKTMIIYACAFNKYQ